MFEKFIFSNQNFILFYNLFEKNSMKIFFNKHNKSNKWKINPKAQLNQIEFEKQINPLIALLKNKQQIYKTLALKHDKNQVQANYINQYNDKCSQQADLISQISKICIQKNYELRSIFQSVHLKIREILQPILADYKKNCLKISYIIQDNFQKINTYYYNLILRRQYNVIKILNLYRSLQDQRIRECFTQAPFSQLQTNSTLNFSSNCKYLNQLKHLNRKTQNKQSVQQLPHIHSKKILSKRINKSQHITPYNQKQSGNIETNQKLKYNVIMFKQLQKLCLQKDYDVNLTINREKDKDKKDIQLPINNLGNQQLQKKYVTKDLTTLEIQKYSQLYKSLDIDITYIKAFIKNKKQHPAKMMNRNLMIKKSIDQWINLRVKFKNKKSSTKRLKFQLL